MTFFVSEIFIYVIYSRVFDRLVLVQNYVASYVFVFGEGWMWEEEDGDVTGIINST